MTLQVTRVSKSNIEILSSKFCLIISKFEIFGGSGVFNSTSTTSIVFF